jgi:hypothetical protein
MKASERGALTNFRTVGRMISGQQKKPGERGALTSNPCRVQREERLKVSIVEESQRARETHILLDAIGRIGQHSEGKPVRNER